MNRTRILVVDDHEAVLKSLKNLLEPEFEIVGELTDGAQLLEVARELEPDIIELDIWMPVVDGLSAARELSAAQCECKIIFLSIHGDPSTVEAALATKPLGYVLKARAGEDLIPAIHAAQSGRFFLSPPLKEHHEKDIQGGDS